jgi:hypothetical protein
VQSLDKSFSFVFLIKASFEPIVKKIDKYGDSLCVSICQRALWGMGLFPFRIAKLGIKKADEE